MQIFQFSSSKLGHLIWELIPVLPISSFQQTAWKWQALSQPRVPPSPSSSFRQGVKRWNEGFPSGNGVMTSSSLCSAPSSTTEVKNIPEQSCIGVQTALRPGGRAQARFVLYRGLDILPGAWFGYFALCETMRIFSLVSVRLSCLLCCALWSGALAHPEDLHNSHTTLGKSRTWETSYLSCRLPLWKTAVGFCFHLSLQATDGVEGSGTFSLRAGRAAVLQIFLGPLLSVSLPLLERTGLTDSKLSLLVLRLKQLTGDLMVSEINLLLSWILPFSGMFVKQVSAVAQGNEV